MTAIVTSTGTIQAKYGATTVGSITCASSNLSSGTASMGSFEFVIMNTTASAQYCRANIDGVWNGTVSAIDSTRSGITVQSSTVATNAAITLTVTTQTSNASAPLTVYGVTAELIR
jgi:hypothetical protein